MSLSDGFYSQAAGQTEENNVNIIKKAFELGISLLNTADFCMPAQTICYLCMSMTPHDVYA